MHAPVSVARSTMASGSASAASDRASARIRRPSASVLSTSMVLPLRMVSTSPGRVASPPSMLSVMGRYALTLTGAATTGSTDMAPMMAAAPHMSIFIIIMPWAVLDGQAPGVERDSLPHVGERRGGGSFGLVGQFDEPRRLAAAPVDAEHSPEAPRLDLRLGPDLGLQSGLAGQRRRSSRRRPGR